MPTSTEWAAEDSPQTQAVKSVCADPHTLFTLLTQHKTAVIAATVNNLITIPPRRPLFARRQCQRQTTVHTLSLSFFTPPSSASVINTLSSPLSQHFRFCVGVYYWRLVTNTSLTSPHGLIWGFKSTQQYEWYAADDKYSFLSGLLINTFRSSVSRECVGLPATLRYSRILDNCCCCCYAGGLLWTQMKQQQKTKIKQRHWTINNMHLQIKITWQKILMSTRLGIESALCLSTQNCGLNVNIIATASV